MAGLAQGLVDARLYDGFPAARSAIFIAARGPSLGEKGKPLELASHDGATLRHGHEHVVPPIGLADDHGRHHGHDEPRKACAAIGAPKRVLAEGNAVAFQHIPVHPKQGPLLPAPQHRIEGGPEEIGDVRRPP